MRNFALIGAAGYIAPRHMNAIKETGNTIVAALDKSDSVGVLDSYFPEADFFVEFERFDRHLEKLRRQGVKIDFVTICSPNYLHDAHIRFGLRHGANVICEKPLVLNPWNIDPLMEIENETGKKVSNILQLRLHPTIINLKKKIQNGARDKIYDVDLKYFTSRGNWYHTSWKGDLSKSGGIATNIGIHFFDMLIWIFGDVQEITVEEKSHKTNAGFLKLERAVVKWRLSIDANELPVEVQTLGKRTFRSITIDNEELEFSDGFSDLHTLSYERILKGKGFDLKEVVKSIELCSKIRNFES